PLVVGPKAPDEVGCGPGGLAGDPVAGDAQREREVAAQPGQLDDVAFGPLPGRHDVAQQPDAVGRRERVEVDALDVFKTGEAAPGGDHDAHAAAREYGADLAFFGRVVEHDDALVFGARSRWVASIARAVFPTPGGPATTTVRGTPFCEGPPRCLEIVRISASRPA